MLTGSDLFVCLIAGFAIPLAILDVARAMFDEGLPVQTNGPQLETRLVPWILALATGPALLFDRVVEGYRLRSMAKSDILWGSAIIIGWAMIYGFVVLQGVRSLAA